MRPRKASSPNPFFFWSRTLAIAAALGLNSSAVHAQPSKGATALLAPPAAKVEDNSASIVLPVVTAGKPAATIFVAENSNLSAVRQRAVEALTSTVQRWTAIDLPVKRLQSGQALPSGPGIVLATTEELHWLAPKLARNAGVVKAGKTADHAFAILPSGDKVFIVGRSIRGVFNGAVYARDFLIDGPANKLVLQTGVVRREPAMKDRVSYTLSIWGNEAEYTAADWRSVLQAFQRDTVNRVYFWTSGHFPSEKYPQTYKCVNGEWDTTLKTRIGTVADLKAIIQHGHDLGLEMYIGGGMGGWCGTYLLTNKKPGTMKTGPGETPWSLCPSHPECRKALTEYYIEMYDALPEADGLYIELAEEFGECRCPDCSKPIDQLGSKQFGGSLMTLARDIAEKIRARHSHAKFAFTVGYDEHAHDPVFYQMMKDLGDERYEWMEARGRWAFTGPDGKDLPAAQFSRNVMKWKQWYNQPLGFLVNEANRAATSDFSGLITSFEPGYATGSFYKTIPFPTDQLPYILTGFAYREMSWQPTMTLPELKQRVHARFFGQEAPASLTDDLMSLRDLIRGVSGKGRPNAKQSQELNRIAAAVEAARPTASPKTRAGLDLMQIALTDTRQHIAKK